MRTRLAALVLLAACAPTEAPKQEPAPVVNVDSLLAPTFTDSARAKLEADPETYAPYLILRTGSSNSR